MTTSAPVAPGVVLTVATTPGVGVFLADGNRRPVPIVKAKAEMTADTKGQAKKGAVHGLPREPGGNAVTSKSEQNTNAGA